ncbi:MAG: hypothetical protein F6J93_16470 [Oscillatoria sp. SIO1A7]|nr:hypothetical protein [Oscillatoria sp. SIO1A7]
MTDTAIATITTTEVETLEQFYSLPERAEVIQFIDKFPFLLPVLLEAPEKIRRYFPEEPLVLKVVRDPEIADYVQLVLSILTTLEPMEAVDRQNQLERYWWSGVSLQVWKQLCVLLEYPDDF